MDVVDDGCCGPRSRAGAKAALQGLQNRELDVSGPSEATDLEVEAGSSATGYHQVRMLRGNAKVVPLYYG